MSKTPGERERKFWVLSLSFFFFFLHSFQFAGFKKKKVSLSGNSSFPVTPKLDVISPCSLNERVTNKTNNLNIYENDTPYGIDSVRDVHCSRVTHLGKSRRNVTLPPSRGLIALSIFVRLSLQRELLRTATASNPTWQLYVQSSSKQKLNYSLTSLKKNLAFGWNFIAKVMLLRHLKSVFDPTACAAQ